MAIDEPLAFDASDQFCQANAIGVMARVPAEGKFVGVFGEMLAGDMMPGTDHSSFEQGEKGFSGIGRSPRTIRIPALKFFARVIDGLMFLPLLQGMAITGVLVRIDDGVPAHAFGQSRAEIFLGHRSHHFLIFL